MPHLPYPLPPTQTLREKYDYDPETGLLTHKRKHGNYYNAGDIAGSPHNTGGITVPFNGQNLLVHRVAWKIYHDQDPSPHYVRHLNRDKSDNRIVNLKLVSHRTNIVMETKPRKNNSSGYTGVQWCKNTRKWRVLRKVHNEHIYLGTFPTREEAARAYNAHVLCDPEHLVNL